MTLQEESSEDSLDSSWYHCCRHRVLEAVRAALTTRWWLGGGEALLASAVESVFCCPLRIKLQGSL